jgi:hypothetical protein
VWFISKFLKYKNMKKIITISFITLFLFSGCNKLKDKTLNTNPYDKEYAGDKVVRISDISSYIDNTNHHRIKIIVTSLTQFYQAYSLYINGTYIGNFLRADFGSGRTSFNETLTGPGNVGETNTYQVKLTYDSGSTTLSDAVNYTTL